MLRKTASLRDIPLQLCAGAEKRPPGVKTSEEHSPGCAARVTGAGAVQMNTPCGKPLSCHHHHHFSSGTVCLQGAGKSKLFGQAAAKGSGVAQAGQERTWPWREGGASPGWKSTSCQDIEAPEQKGMKEERPLALDAVREGLEVV